MSCNVEVHGSYSTELSGPTGHLSMAMTIPPRGQQLWNMSKEVMRWSALWSWWPGAKPISLQGRISRLNTSGALILLGLKGENMDSLTKETWLSKGGQQSRELSVAQIFKIASLLSESRREDWLGENKADIKSKEQTLVQGCYLYILKVPKHRPCLYMFVSVSELVICWQRKI